MKLIEISFRSEEHGFNRSRRAYLSDRWHMYHMVIEYVKIILGQFFINHLYFIHNFALTGPKRSSDYGFE